MNINLNNYRKNTPVIYHFMDRHPELELTQLINRLSGMTGCPLIVICYFIGEKIGFSDELNKIIKDLKRFYNYEDTG